MAKFTKKIKAYRILQAIIFRGDRVEVGTVLTLSVEELASLNPAYYEELNAEKEEEKVAEEKKIEEEEKEGSKIDI